MFLKSLTMHGFKSFPDKTVISFNRGITAIVGPNGSGKSNISDAVRWVLGEMSPKSLRGSKMEDVIFNGTSKRKSAGYAEVIMTLDNTDRKSSYNADEIDVCRRLYRTGESEYYINNKQVRLKDVVDIFLNTGIGREGYSVIGQGKIADVISRKNDERRGIFEEAAGISKLRYQKKEAVSKLEKVGLNLERIGDILTEVENRLPTLKRQSEKAEKYTVLKKERTELEVSSFARRISIIDKEKEKNAENLALEEEKLAKAESDLEKSDRLIDENYIETGKQKAQESRLRTERESLITSLSENASTLSVLKNDTEHFETTKAEIDISINENLEKIKSLEIEEKSLTENLEITEKKICENSEEIQKISKTVQTVKEKITELKESVGKLDEEREKISARRSENELILKEGESYNAVRRERLDAVKLQKQSLETALEKAIEEKNILVKESSQKTEKSEELKENLKKSQLKLDELEEECEKLSENKQKLRLKFLEINQRRETLERMERLLEGFSGSVKAVMSASHDNKLRGIHGPISKLIVTDSEYITAIETCLGAAMQNIVVEDEEAAKSAIAYLKRTNSGRATFLPLSTIKGSVTDVSAVKNKSGFIAVASDIVRCDEKYRMILTQLLGRTVVCDNIDSATAIARAMNFKTRVITLDGQLINAGGSFTGGQILKSSAILTRRADIEELERESRTLEEQINKINLSVCAKQKEKSSTESVFLEEERESELLVRRLFELEKNIYVCDERITQVTENLKLASEEYEKLSHTENITRDSMSEFEVKRENIEKEYQSAVLKKSEIEQTIAEQEKTLFELGEKMTSLNTVRTEFEIESASSEEKRDGIGNMKKALKETVISLKTRLEELSERRNGAEEKIADIMVERADIERNLKQKDAQISECVKKINVLETQSLEIRSNQKNFTEQKETAFRLATQLKSKLEESENEKQSILTRLAEDYDMDFDAALIFAASSHSDHTLSKEEKEERLSYLRSEMKKLGSVSIESIEEYRETKERYDFLKSQYDDAFNAKNTLEKMIVQLDTSMREKFSESLAKIQKAFKETFVELFGGGSAEITISGDDVLECSIDINVQPPGKIIKSLSLLSGGEQSIVAIALYLAILKVSPSPFCIFDEIEAALDDANVARFGEYLKKYSHSTQFIVITHRRGTMEAADMLYGITMQEKGVSDFIRVSLNEYMGDIN